MRPFDGSMREQGFTFNEILVAMAITGIGVLGLAATSVVVVRGNRASNNYAIANSLAQDKMEELRTRAILANENLCPLAGESGINATGAAGGIFNRCWTIADSTLGGRLKQIEITVNWRDSEQHVIRLTTLIYGK